METLLETVYNPERFRTEGHQLIDLLADYLKKAIEGREVPVLLWNTPEEQLSFWKKDFEQIGNNNILPFFQNVIDRSIHMHHPKNFGHQTAVPAPASALAGLLSDLLNNAMPIYETGSVSTIIERVVINMVNKFIGYTENAGGFMTSGGSLGNLTAILAAKNKQQFKSNNLAILVSEEAHYSIARIAHIMGLGEAGLIKIPSDENFKMNIEQLEVFYKQALKEGKEILAVIGCACTTATGTYDDIAAIGNFCQKHSLWFHVDGAHGGAVIFTDKYRNLVKGIEQADSVLIDFHKMLMTPTLCSALLFKNDDHSYATFSQKAAYLWEKDSEKEWYNLAKRTFECTKRMMSIKVYTLLKIYGFEVFKENVTRLYNLGKCLAKIIQKTPSFELATFPESNIVCFRFIKGSGDLNYLNKLNKTIRQKLISEGEFYIVHTQIGQTYYLRTAIMNPLTRVEDFEELLIKIKQIASTID